MRLTSIGVVLGIVASVLKIVNGIVDLINKCPEKLNEPSAATGDSFSR